MPNQDTTGILWALHQSRVSFPGHNLPSFAVSAWTFSGPLSWRKGHHYEETKASYPFMKSYISILWAIVCSWSIKIKQQAASISRHVYIIYLIKIEIDLDVIIYISSWHDLVDVVGTRGWLACKAPPNETEFFSSTGTRCLPQSRFCSWGGPVDRG